LNNRYLNAAWRYLEDESKDKKKKSFDYTGWKKVGTTTDTPRQMNGALPSLLP
jgi:hypothetical protein